MGVRRMFWCLFFVFHVIVINGFSNGFLNRRNHRCHHPNKIDFVKTNWFHHPSTKLYNQKCNDYQLIRSFHLLHDNDGQDDDDPILFHEVSAVHDKKSEEEEDEVELWYPTTRRFFVVGNANDSHNTPDETSDTISTDNLIITIRQTSFGCGKLGSSIWPSAIALCCHFLQFSNHPDKDVLTQNSRVLELGAGCGLPSAFLLASDHEKNYSIVATDFWQANNDDDFDKERLFPTHLFGVNLEYNMKINSCDGNNKHNIGQVWKYDWHEYTKLDENDHLIREFAPEIIIGSDLIYYPTDVEPFLQTITRLFRYGAKAAIFFFPLSPDNKREALPEFQNQILTKNWFQQQNDDSIDVQLDEVKLNQIIYNKNRFHTDTDNDQSSSSTQQDTFLRLVINKKS